MRSGQRGIDGQSESHQSATRRFLAGVRLVFILLLPGLIAVTAMLPATSMGPSAFAIRQDFRISIAQIGIAYTAFFLASAALAGVGGWLITRWRTLQIIRAGLLVTSLLTALMSLSGSAGQLMIFSVLTGAVNGTITPAVNVLITRLVPVKLRGLAFGVKVAAAPLASALAAAGAWAAANFDFPWRAIYWIGAGISFLVVVGTYFLGLPRKPVAAGTKPGGTDAMTKRQHRSLILLAFGALLGASGTGVLPPFLVDSLIDDGIAPGQAASLLAIGSSIGFVSRVLTGALSDVWPKPISHLNAVSVMLMIAAVSMGVLGIGHSSTTLVAATITFFALGWSWPGLVHYAVLVTHAQAPALATTYMQIGTFFGSVLGPLGFGLIAEYGSFTAAWAIAALSVLFAAAFLAWGARRLAAEIAPGPVEAMSSTPIDRDRHPLRDH